MPGRSMGTEGARRPGIETNPETRVGTPSATATATVARRERWAARLWTAGRVARAWSDAVRLRVASLVWLLAVLAAVVLAAAALLVALGANADNALVSWVLATARAIDGPFWKVFEFTREDAGGRVLPDETKEVLVNWGLAAVAYLAVGRVLERVIRP